MCQHRLHLVCLADLEEEQKNDVVHVMFKRTVVPGEVLIRWDIWHQLSVHIDHFASLLTLSCSCTMFALCQQHCFRIQFATPITLYPSICVASTPASMPWAHCNQYCCHVNADYHLDMHEISLKAQHSTAQHSTAQHSTATQVENMRGNLAVCREGEHGDNFYVIESGHFKVTKADGGKEKLLFAYHDEGAFGELALMYNCPRAATVTVSHHLISYNIYSHPNQRPGLR